MLTQTVTITQNSNPNIIIGRRSTYETQQVIFDVSWLIQTYGEGTAELLIKRPKDASAYPVVATLDGNTLTWTVSDTDTQDKGHGECEIYWYVNGGLAKSCICGITILRDIGDTTETAPDPYETWVDELARLGSETLANAQAAEQSANNAAQSATEAGNSAAAALESEENALDSENAAKASEQAAAASAQGAEQSATAARQSATEAAQSASEAESSAANAQESAENSSASADRAEQAAASIEGDTERAEAAARTAQGAASDASRFAGTASTKATEAAGSAATAEQAATTATQKAADALASATAAAGSASSAYASATSAAGSASSASASATAAGNAQTAAETAQGKAEDAQEAAETAAQSIEDSAAQIDTNTADILSLKSALNTKADIDGTYEDLTAGNAYELLSDRGDTNQQPYLFRQTGGDSSAYNREQLKKIVGGTVAWNQFANFTLIPTASHGITYSSADGKSVTFNGTATSAENRTGWFGIFEEYFNTKINNKVLIIPKIISGSFDNGAILYNLFGSKWCDFNTPMISPVGQTQTSQRIGTNVISGTVANDFTVTFICIDLTQMFGTDIADYIYSLEQATAGAGVAFFRKLFPADYYDYNPGELLSVEGVSAHETVGFNQWDEEWEEGTINNDTGLPSPDQKNIRAVNFCSCVPNTTYYFYSGSHKPLRVYWYDATYGYISTEIRNNNATTAPSNAAWFKIRSTTEYGNVYNHDICINISDPKRNGTYEPYKKRTYPLDSSLTLRGIPKLDSNNHLYYDGDEYEPDGTVNRRYGIVDLGTLNWAYHSSSGNMYIDNAISDRKFPNCLALCSIFTRFYNRYGGDASGVADVTTNNSFAFQDNSSVVIGRIIVRDTAYTDAAAFKAAMSGVMLVYELATPTTETTEPYRELEICDRDGTEEFVSTSIVPVGHETFYPVNVFDYIDRLTEPDADMIADSAIAANKYFSVGNRLFLSTASIAAGAMIIPGTNCTETSLAAALNALNA